MANSLPSAEKPPVKRIQSFAPIADVNARTLILGSMPGKASLQAGQYYAHTRNSFWKIMTVLFDADSALDYASRTQLLTSHHIALWDAAHSCIRSSSLDADIEAASVVINDFASFFSRHRQITRVYFNGATAENLFRRQVLPTLQPDTVPELHRLPSTSPAHATLSFNEKLDAWRVITVAC